MDKDIEYIYLAETQSTNQIATAFLNEAKISPPSCIYTFNQTSGKGQFDRSWYGGRNKNICLTMVLQFVGLPVQYQLRLNKAIALRLRAYFQTISGIDMKIKWPNDLYAGDKKLGGLLIQNSIVNKEIAYCIIGVGVNINEMDFPSSLPNPVSLLGLTGKEWDLIELIKGITNQLCFGTEEIIHGIHLEDQYNKHLFKYQQSCSFITKDGVVVTGKINGVDDKGFLHLISEDERHTFTFGEVQMII